MIKYLLLLTLLVTVPVKGQPPQHRRPVTQWQCAQVPPTTRPVCFQQVRRDRIREEMKYATPEQRRAIQKAREEFRRKVNNILRNR